MQDKIVTKPTPKEVFDSFIKSYKDSIFRDSKATFKDRLAAFNSLRTLRKNRNQFIENIKDCKGLVDLYSQNSHKVFNKMCDKFYDEDCYNGYLNALNSLENLKLIDDDERTELTQKYQDRTAKDRREQDSIYDELFKFIDSERENATQRAKECVENHQEVKKFHDFKRDNSMDRDK